MKKLYFILLLFLPFIVSAQVRLGYVYVDTAGMITVELDPAYTADSSQIIYFNQDTAAGPVATRYWVNGLGFLTVESDPVWISDSSEYFYKIDFLDSLSNYSLLYALDTNNLSDSLRLLWLHANSLDTGKVSTLGDTIWGYIRSFDGIAAPQVFGTNYTNTYFTYLDSINIGFYTSVGLGKLKPRSVTGIVDWYLPDSSGTIALTEYLPSDTGKVNTTGNDTIWGNLLIMPFGTIYSNSFTAQRYGNYTVSIDTAMVEFTSASFGGRLGYNPLSSTRTWYLPDSSGTIALTEYLPKSDSVWTVIHADTIYSDSIITVNACISVADDAMLYLPDATTISGTIWVDADNEYTTFFVQTNGTVILPAGTGSIDNTDNDGFLCIYDSGTQAIIKNRLGSRKTLCYTTNYKQP